MNKIIFQVRNLQYNEAEVSILEYAIEMLNITKEFPGIKAVSYTHLLIKIAKRISIYPLTLVKTTNKIPKKETPDSKYQ